MKIVVFALSGIGDALMFTPALKLLRKDLPEAHITAVVMFGAVKDIYERTGLFTEVIHFDFIKQGAVNSLKFMLSLRNRVPGGYDYSVNVYPSNRKEYNIISRLSGSENRVGVRYLRADNANFGFLNNLYVREDDSLHNAEENTRLAELITGKKYDEIPPYEFPLTAADEAFADKYLTDNPGTAERGFIGFHPGCATMKNHINRRWEPEKFAELAAKINDELNMDVLLFGGPEEAELRRSILEKTGGKRVFEVKAGNIAESAALIKRSRVFVTNDSSLMHISSAMGASVFAIIGPTNTNYIKPWKTRHFISSLNLECAPCFIYSPSPLKCTRTDVKYKCVRELTVAKVFSDLKQFLGDISSEY